MKKIVDNAYELIGNTPILNAKKYAEESGIINANILAKLEYFNPTGSSKDRASLFMIEDAEKNGLLKKGGTIIEPTSGNTGIGIASIATQKGYNVILTMPETMSEERQKLLKIFGAKIELTDGKKGMKGAIDKANELKNKIEGSVILGQFDNYANVVSHKETTAKEIFSQTDGNIDAVVVTVGTGGTITGIGEYLKSKNENIKIIAVEPAKSPVLSKGISGSHNIQGIGSGFIPKVLNTKIYDEIITVNDEDAFLESKKFALKEGIVVGISSGAALKASLIVANRLNNNSNKKKNIVVLLPDSGDRYLSTELFK